MTELVRGTSALGIPGSVLYTASGCVQCDGPDEALIRHVTDSSGNTASKPVFDASSSLDWHPWQFLAAPDGSVLGAVACVQCVGSPGKDRPLVPSWGILVSVDEGASWQRIHEFTGSSAVLFGVDRRQGRTQMLVRVTASDSAAPEWLLLGPGGAATVSPPASAGERPYGQLLRDSGELVWRTANQRQVFDASGRLLFEPRLTAQEAADLQLVDRLEDRWFLSWAARDQQTSAITGTMIGVFRPDGSVERLFELSGESVPIKLHTSQTLLTSVNDGDVSTSTRMLPAIINLKDATVTVIDLPYLRGVAGRNRLEALSR
ncbi:MAG: hypothetical protein HY875_02745 [Chloroflexi bacterium]|nr:hypothetical protein [Chloroflexota bacterium]